MPRNTPLKPFQGWVTGKREWEVLHRDGRNQMQVQVAVLATSRAMVAAILTEVVGHKITVGFVKDYIGETGNAETIDALRSHPRGTVLVRAMDPGGTVKGKTGWVPV